MVVSRIITRPPKWFSRKVNHYKISLDYQFASVALRVIVTVFKYQSFSVSKFSPSILIRMVKVVQSIRVHQIPFQRLV